VEAIPSFDESRQRRCGNQNSGGTADCCNPPRFTHRTLQVHRIT
jgi:hypothetical protein